MRQITTYEDMPPRPATKKQTSVLRWQQTFKTKEKRDHQAAICKIVIVTVTVQGIMIEGGEGGGIVIGGEGGGGTQELVYLVITGRQTGVGPKVARRRPTLDSLLIQ
jgi:hypothetical protein